MKVSLLIFVLSVLVFNGVHSYDNHHHDHDSHHHSRGKGHHHHGDRHHGDHQHRSSKKSSHQHHSTKQQLLFPSGTSHLISNPRWSSIRDCPGKATLVRLSSHNNRWKKEYEIVKSELEKTKGNVGGFQGFKNVTIDKVFNSCLWYKYKYRKEQVLAEAQNVNEKMLFHASVAPFTSVNKGLDERYTTLEQGELGAGLYFSNNPYKSHTYTKLRDNGTRVLMLCRVALGKVHEKVKSPHAPVGFQSVSSTDGTTMEYSIYRGEQAYPDYIITYRAD